MSGHRTGNYHSDASPITCRVTPVLVLLVLVYARPLRFLPLNTNSEICDDLPELSNCQFYHFIAYVMTRPVFDLKMPGQVFTLQGPNILPSYGSSSIHTCTVLTCSKNRYSSRRLTLYLCSLVCPLFHLANSLPKKLFKLSSRLGYSCCKNGNWPTQQARPCSGALRRARRLSPARHHLERRSQVLLVQGPGLFLICRVGTLH